jgi:rsbT antagonist protein RsbS
MNLQGIHLTPIGAGDLLLEPSESLDPSRDDQLETLVAALQRHQARRLIYDLKNVRLIDTVYFRWLTGLQAICQIAGVRMIVIHMQPTAAFALSQLIRDRPRFECALDIEHLPPEPPASGDSD